MVGTEVSLRALRTPERRVGRRRTLDSHDEPAATQTLYQVFEPDRFDVVVFKNPTNPWENYIKRLVGLPGEQIAL